MLTLLFVHDSLLAPSSFNALTMLPRASDESEEAVEMDSGLEALSCRIRRMNLNWFR